MNFHASFGIIHHSKSACVYVVTMQKRGAKPLKDLTTFDA